MEVLHVRCGSIFKECCYCLITCLDAVTYASSKREALNFLPTSKCFSEGRHALHMLATSILKLAKNPHTAWIRNPQKVRISPMLALTTCLRMKSLRNGCRIPDKPAESRTRAVLVLRGSCCKSGTLWVSTKSSRMRTWSHLPP